MPLNFLFVSQYLCISDELNRSSWCPEPLALFGAVVVPAISKVRSKKRSQQSSVEFYSHFVWDMEFGTFFLAIFDSHARDVAN